jgi:pilus assembly protein CpaC
MRIRFSEPARVGRLSPKRGALLFGSLFLAICVGCTHTNRDLNSASISLTSSSASSIGSAPDEVEKKTDSVPPPIADLLRGTKHFDSLSGVSGPSFSPSPALGLEGNGHSIDPGIVLAQGVVQLPQPRVLKQIDSPFLERSITPQQTLDLVVGVPELLVLKQAPKRVLLGGDEKNAIVTMTIPSEREISLVGTKVGRIGLTLWFTDPKDATKQEVVTFLIRVQPDPTEHQNIQERLAVYYKNLECEINQAFPNSRISLKLIGSNLLLCGQTYDTAETAQILKLFSGTKQLPPGIAPTTIIQHGLAQTRVDAVPGEAPEAAKEAAAQLDLGPPGIAAAAALLGTNRVPTINVINMLHVPGEQQVMLKVVVAEINRTAARSLGVNYNITNSQGLTVFSNTTGNIAGSTSSGSGGGIGGVATTPSPLANLQAALGAGRVQLVISALKNMDLARSLAEPNLVTMNGQPASFQAGGQFPVPVVTGFTAAGLQGVSFVPFGVQLQFTPTITDKDRIRLELKAEVSTRDTSTGSTVGGSSVPGLNTRNFKSMVEMREGETLAVAGLIQTNYGADSSRIPFFGDIPFIGRLAGFDRTATGEQELVILVTPVLIHPTCERDRRGLPGQDVFEPSDVEFFLGSRLEGRRPVDYRTPIRTDWWRIFDFCHEPPGNGVPAGYPPAPAP